MSLNEQELVELLVSEEIPLAVVADYCWENGRPALSEHLRLCDDDPRIRKVWELVIYFGEPFGEDLTKPHIIEHNAICAERNADESSFWFP